jgi:hypothetical protein
MEQLTIQSLGFLVGFQEDIKVPGRMEQLTMQSLGFLVGFQEDINFIFFVVIIIIIIIILACPGTRWKSGQTSGSCSKITLHDIT